MPPNTRAGIPLSTSKLEVQSWKFEVRPPDGLEHPTSNFEPSNIESKTGKCPQTHGRESPFLLQSWKFKVGSSKFALQMGLNIQRPTSNHPTLNRKQGNARKHTDRNSLSTSKLEVQSWKFEVRPPDGLEHPTSNFEHPTLNRKQGNDPKHTGGNPPFYFKFGSSKLEVGSSKFALQMGLNIQRPTSNIQH